MHSLATPVLGHKTSFNKFKRIETQQSMSSDHDGIKLEVIKRSKFGIPTNIWQVNIAFVSSLYVEGENKRKIRKHFELDENKNTTNQNNGMTDCPKQSAGSAQSLSKFQA